MSHPYIYEYEKFSDTYAICTKNFIRIGRAVSEQFGDKQNAIRKFYILKEDLYKKSLNPSYALLSLLYYVTHLNYLRIFLVSLKLLYKENIETVLFKLCCE